MLSIVSQRTGYPEDVLDLDLDLEADLSIDSIKRLEIVGELSDRLGLQSLLKDKDSALETLAALKTLRAIVDWLKLNTGTEGAEGTEGVSQDGGLETTLPEVAQIERTERAKRIEGQENNSHENRRGGGFFSGYDERIRSPSDALCAASPGCAASRGRFGGIFRQALSHH